MLKWVSKLGAAGIAAIAMGCAVVPACTIDQAPTGLRRTPPGPGAIVRYDMMHKPLPDIPLPNDVAAWPDPSSRTGLRLNASLFASTDIERVAREKFGRMEGWGTFPWITVAFEPRAAESKGSAIDLANIKRRHQGDDYDLADDAIYLVNLATGIPVPVDLGEGSFNYTLRDKQKYWPNDSRRSEQNLLFETYDETARSGGATQYRPDLDTDFDGILDRPNLDDPRACPPPPAELDSPDQLERDRCIADHLLTWYERETDSLIIRPLIPLEEKTPYAVVLTDRLLDSDGDSIKSPFEFIYHPMQEMRVATLQKHLQNPAVSAYYGDIGGTGLDHVAFTWAFTTQPVYEDMQLLRDGLYGQGPFAHLGNAFPPELSLNQAVGLATQEDVADGSDPDEWKEASSCSYVRDNIAVVHYDDIRDLLKQMAEQALGMKGQELEALMKSYEAVDYIVIGKYDSPYLLEGGPKSTDPNATFNLNFKTGEGNVYADTVYFWLIVPKAQGVHQQPFPVNIYGHGYTSAATEILVYAGSQARQGLATLGIQAAGHGLGLSDEENALIDMVFKGACLAPFGDALRAGRARDLNNDGVVDSGGDFWTSYIFHTRDLVRQSVLDHMQIIRILRTFDGQRTGPDYDGDGEKNIAGDFDNDGVVDVGGTTVPYTAWGESLGGILSGVLGAIDPYVVASAPTAGGGGLIDIGVRSFQGGVVEAVVLRLLGPLVVGVPTGENPDRSKTSCTEGQTSVRWVVTDVNDTREVEIACVGDLPATGGTIVVHNRANGQTRCARTDAQGRFRMGIPSSVGDPIAIELHGVPDNVHSYGTCAIVDESKRIRTIATWQSPVLESGATDAKGKSLCEAPQGCARFQGRAYAVGEELTAPAEGYGYVRQTPSLRRFIGLAQSAIDPADPINYAPYFSLKPIRDPWGNVVPAHALLTLNTIGDMNVPINSGINYGRASGAIPFLRPDAAEKYPALADYATPQELYQSLGSKTPNRVLIDGHVVEGIFRLARHPAGALCRPNEIENSTCQPRCPPLDPEGACHSGQQCVEGICRTPTDAWECQAALFDPNDLSEGRMLWHQQSPSTPLRLARVSASASAESLEQLWAPRLQGIPYATSNAGAWDASRRLTAHLDAYVIPKGKHCFEAPNPCQNWDYAQYLIQLTTRFFASEGRDLYYLSNPASHQCLLGNACAFH